MNNVLKALRFTAINLAALAAVVVVASLAGYSIGTSMPPPSVMVLTVASCMYQFFIVCPGMLLSALTYSYVSGVQKTLYFCLSHTALFALLYGWHISPQAQDLASFFHLLVEAHLIFKMTAIGFPLYVIALTVAWIIRWGD